jgi:hypothetical protein
MIGHAPMALRAVYWRVLLGAAWCGVTVAALLAHG